LHYRLRFRFWSPTPFFISRFKLFHSQPYVYVYNAISTTITTAISEARPTPTPTSLPLEYMVISLYWHIPPKQSPNCSLQQTPRHPLAIRPKMKTRQLFSQLPAELRNEVYTHLSTSTTASTQGIPLPLKNYASAHIGVQICAIHRGSTSLLTLGRYGFLEGEEYRSWLLSRGVEVWVGVHFLGHLNTFVQKDWDAKMLASLRKLGKRYPWLKNVARYRIRIDWEPKLDSLTRAPRGVSGEIADRMVQTLIRLQNPRVQEK
jgi:hypothetical protein